MKNLIKSLFSLFLLFFSCFSLAMEHPKAGKTSLFFGPKKAQGQKYTIEEKQLKLINKMGIGSFIAIDAFSFSNQKIIQALKKAHVRGATIDINVDGTREENKKTALELCKAGIPVALYNASQKITNGFHPHHLHYKRLLAEYTKNNKRWYCIVDGSSNFTNISKSHHETEVFIKEEEESDTYISHKNDHFEISSLCKKAMLSNDQKTLVQIPSISPRRRVKTEHRTTLAKTPQKIHTVNSRTTDIVATIQKRIENAESGDMLEVTTMTLDDRNCIQALMDAVQRGVITRLFIDGQDVKKHAAKFNNLSKHGVEIFVFNYDQLKKVYEYPTLLHSKSVVRMGEKPLVVITSANLTGQSNDDYNDCSFFPNNIEQAQAVLENNRALEKECIRFTELEKELASSNKRKRKPESPKKPTVQPAIKKPRYIAQPSDLLKNLFQSFQTLENDIVSTYDVLTPEAVKLFNKRFAHLSKLYLPLQSSDGDETIAKKISSITALLAT